MNDNSIIRFDAIEFDVLKCAYPDGGGYYYEGDRADRARLLMKEGILHDEPSSEWVKHGWKLTDKGIEYRLLFMDAVQQKHGHRWMTNRETSPQMYDEGDEYGDSVDIFAMSVGYHNGMKCLRI